ncbi:hypothetical protein BH10CHL1_BH10CHL1_07870 [soil metagenome]
MVERVSAIVLNWNGKSDTLACLKSLQMQTMPVDIVVVDNGSIDDSVAAIRQNYPEVTILETGCNLGYSGGNNVGIRHALATGATYIFVLNNDTRLDPECTVRLLEDCKVNPGSVAVAPKSLYMDRPETICFAGGRITASGDTQHIGMGQPDGPAYTVTQATEWITGCALFVSRAGFEQVGLFDERFFLLFEDSDWSLRARRLGYGLRYVGTACVWHQGSASFGGKRSPIYQYYHTRNQLLWLERNYPFHRFVRLAGHLLRRAWSRTNRLAHTAQSQRILRRAILLGASDYLWRRFGQGNLSSLGGTDG